MLEALLLLIGFALGTLQVLTIDWVKRRREHKTHLRALRAELERLETLRHKHDWGKDGPQEDSLPKPPSITSAYTNLVVATDFSLTDEFVGDNTQLVLLTILDGCGVLQDTSSQMRDRLAKLRTETDKRRRNTLAEEMVALAQSYDEKLDTFRYSVRSGLDDLDRRLKEARYHHQVVRQLRRLPEGENPPVLAPGDPRLTEMDERED